MLFDLELRCGRHTEVIPELSELVESQSLNERFCAQLMVALYRSGRQTEALAVYRRMRMRMDADLGVEPSPTLANTSVRFWHTIQLYTTAPIMQRCATERIKGSRKTMSDYSLDWNDGALVAVDQRELPRKMRLLQIKTVDQLVDAVRTLAIRGLLPSVWPVHSVWRSRCGPIRPPMASMSSKSREKPSGSSPPVRPR
jgi:hypothetical protein